MKVGTGLTERKVAESTSLHLLCAHSNLLLFFFSFPQKKKWGEGEAIMVFFFVWDISECIVEGLFPHHFCI